MKVAPANVIRALRFMQAVITMLEKRGYELKVRQEDTVVIISGQEMKIALREKVRTTKKPGKYGFDNEYTPEGKLILKLDSYPQKEWQDGPRTLEEQLPDILARLETQGQRKMAQQIESDKWHREWEEKERVRKEAEQRQQQELANFKHLLKASGIWQKAERIRAYIQQVEQKAANNNELTEETQQWIQWARNKVDWYDPLTNGSDKWLKDMDGDELE